MQKIALVMAALAASIVLASTSHAQEQMSPTTTTETVPAPQMHENVPPAIGPTCKRVTTTVTREVCGSEVQAAPPVRAKRKVKAKRYAAPPRPPVYRERIERPRYVHRPPPSRGRWVPIEHRWSMRDAGGPWDRYAIAYGQWKYTVWHGEQRRCRGGSRSRGIDRHCEALR